ncbi:MAG TPA: hypothetical protein VF278_12485, partial [Pirellulales bacterium]
VLRDAPETEGRLSLHGDDLMHAVARLRGDRESLIGFGRSGTSRAKQNQPGGDTLTAALVGG